LALLSLTYINVHQFTVTAIVEALQTSRTNQRAISSPFKKRPEKGKIGLRRSEYQGAMPGDIPTYNVASIARQSPPIDWSTPVKIDPTFVKGKTIVITGGASGFGAGFSKQWASYGANIIIGDIIVADGEKIVAELRQETNNPNHHFVRLDVTSWPSQVDFFREAARLSPHGGIDTVVANAGINNATEQAYFHDPPIDYLNTPSLPPPPHLMTLDVNLTGVLYTTHLGLWYLRHNTGSKPVSSMPSPGERDRHLLLLGSVAGLHPLVTQTLYTVSKHAVLGLFRCLRAQCACTGGVRVNMICPYFINTPLLPLAGKAMLAGGATGVVEDVVQAASMFVSRPDIIGRAVMVGPKVKARVPVDENGVASLIGSKGIPAIEDAFEVINPGKAAKTQEGADSVVQERAIWEIYAEDFEDTDLFNKRMIRILNAVGATRGWYGYAVDMFDVVKTGVSRALFGRY
jgi:NAD(P)-dependent dehydrogenase (short-subunit alcohol dehydrogenase family)